MTSLSASERANLWASLERSDETTHTRALRVEMGSGAEAIMVLHQSALDTCASLRQRTSKENFPGIEVDCPDFTFIDRVLEFDPVRRIKSIFVAGSVVDGFAALDGEDVVFAWTFPHDRGMTPA